MTTEIKDAMQFAIWSVSGPTNDREEARVEQQIEEAYAEYMEKTGDQSQRVPDGWQLVPMQPTAEQHIAAMEFALEHMKSHGVTALSPFKDYPPLRETTAGMYRAMIAAAPAFSRPDDPPQTARKWQIGIASATADDVNWQQDWVEALTEAEAVELAGNKGYYRNVRVRMASPLTRPKCGGTDV